MQSRRFRADIESASGQRIRDPLDELANRRIDGAAGSRLPCVHHAIACADAGRRDAALELIGGIGPKSYAAGILLLALVAIAIAGLLIRAIATGEWAGGLFLIGFAALFGWQIGGFMRRNRPRAYAFDHLPETLLP